MDWIVYAGTQASFIFEFLVGFWVMSRQSFVPKIFGWSNGTFTVISGGAIGYDLGKVILK